MRELPTFDAAICALKSFYVCKLDIEETAWARPGPPPPRESDGPLNYMISASSGHSLQVTGLRTHWGSHQNRFTCPSDLQNGGLGVMLTIYILYIPRWV